MWISMICCKLHPKRWAKSLRSRISIFPNIRKPSYSPNCYVFRVFISSIWLLPLQVITLNRSASICANLLINRNHHQQGAINNNWFRKIIDVNDFCGVSEVNAFAFGIFNFKRNIPTNHGQWFGRRLMVGRHILYILFLYILYITL